MEIRRFHPGDAAAVERLNTRLAAGGSEHRLYPEGTQDNAPGPVRQRLFVAADGDEIRGGIWLKEHDIRLRGRTVPAGWAKYPVSESLVNPAFGGVPASLMFCLIREQPNLMALGLGGHETPFARLLKGMRWIGVTVPFAARAVRPARVLRGLSHLRRSPGRRLVLDVAAASGLGWLAVRAAQAAARRSLRRHDRRATVEEIGEFAPRTDVIWQAVRDRYGLICTRDAAHLEAQRREFAHRGDLRWIGIRHDGRDVGWASVVRTDFGARPAADPTFGTLTIGMLADVCAAPEDADRIVGLAVRHLEARGVDLIVSNQLHPAWEQALRRAGFLPGPSNFAFYCSPALARELGDGVSLDRTLIHMNRGDCDGPVWT